MKLSLPTMATLLGIAGLVPFLGCAVMATSYAQADAQPWLTALVCYGAVILSFLGGVHWGLALGAPDTVLAEQNQLRLGLGVLASLAGWVALLAALLWRLEAGLAILIAGLIAMVVMEARLARDDLLPAHYMWLRWSLSGVVVAVLLVTLVLRLLGARIFFAG